MQNLDNIDNIIYMNLKRLCIFVGISLILLGFVLGFKFQDGGCGTCGGYSGFYPKLTTAIQYIPSFSRPSQLACATMGCSPGIIFPIFLDILTSGLVLIFLGYFIRLKQK